MVAKRWLYPRGALRPEMGRGEGSAGWIFTPTGVSAGWILTPTGVSNFHKNDLKRVAEYEKFTNITQRKWLRAKKWYPTGVCLSFEYPTRRCIWGGLITKLHSMGINATTFMYRGADIPTIQSRVTHILKPGMNHNYIVLQVAGNDATKQDSKRIFAHYETLIRDIRSRCPSATIVLCKVPPRRGTEKTMHTIYDINAYVNVIADRLQNVLSVDVCPESVDHFRKDCTHFNRHGVAHYAQKLVGILRNFYQVYTTVCM